ncbi:MAG: sigma-70 family RNA polymerase sigma factor [Cellulosilyticaceae bacterium]
MKEILKYWEEYAPLVNKWSYQMSKIDYTKEDWEQEAYLIFIKAYETFNGDYQIGFGAYFRMLLYRQGKRYMTRTISKTPKLTVFDKDDMPEEVADEEKWKLEDDVIYGMTLLEDGRRLRRAITELTEDEQDILYRFYFHRQKAKEIAVIHNCSASALESRKKRMIKKLKKIYDKTTDR